MIIVGLILGVFGTLFIEMAIALAFIIKKIIETKKGGKN